MLDDKPKRKPEDFKNVCVSKATHSAVKDYLDENNEAHIGKFFDNAAKERLDKLRNSQSDFKLMSTPLLLFYGWEKVGGSLYWKNENTIKYDGVNWLFNNELLTEQNYLEKIK